MTDYLYSAKGLTGSIPDLIEAFGVQVGPAAIYARMKQHPSWTFEQCLLMRGYRPPLRADNPLPIKPRKIGGDRWEQLSAQLEAHHGKPLNTILTRMVARGASREELVKETGLPINHLFYKDLARRAEELRRGIRQAEQLRRQWHIRRANPTRRAAA